MVDEKNVGVRSTSPLLSWRVHACFYVCLFCAAWNLFGDVCFIDFYLSYNTFEDFGTIDTVLRPSNLFDFKKTWPIKLAQSGGWMYPLWALATTYPLYLGLIPAGSWRLSLAPCALLAYGLCVVGGALHSGFAFATILPTALHHDPKMITCAQCVQLAQLGQKQVMDTYVFGYTPGPLAVFGASIWIASIVLTRETRFPKWFVLFTPVVTLAWVAAAGAFLLPKPFAFYFAGSFGTWIILIMNAAASYLLWNLQEHARRSD